MKFWPFPILRNYSTSNALTDLFLRFAGSPEVQFERIDNFYIKATCSAGTLVIWDENRWYAWAQTGVFTNAHGESVKWSNAMPSRYAVKKMRKAAGVILHAHDQLEAALNAAAAN
jgi:hypothetical protein